jgi:hypothetical protein
MRDTDTTNARYSDAVILDLINEAEDDINNQSLLSNVVTSYILTSGTSYYNVPSNYFQVNEIYFKKNTGETKKLSEITQNKLYQSRPDWERARGEPDTFWISDSTFTTTTSSVTKRISYIPVPNNLSTGTITMWYYSLMTPLTADSDLPLESMREMSSYHHMIIYYVTMRLKIIDGIMDEAQAYQTLYVNSLNKFKRMFGNLPETTPTVPIQSTQQTNGQ